MSKHHTISPRTRPPSRPGALAEIREAGPLAVAARAGLKVVAGTRIAPCPACSEVARSRTDRRPGPVFTTGEGRKGWKCHRCDAKGDAVTLLAWAALGRVPPRGDRAGWRAVLEAAGSEPEPLHVDPPTPAPARERDQRRVAEALELWARCELPGLDTGIVDYAARRGLTQAEILRVAGLGMVGWIPEGLPLPRWAAYGGKPWSEAGYQVLTPYYGPAGELVGVRARWAGDGPPPGGAPKTPAGVGAVLVGSALAPCPVARALLAAGPSATPGPFDTGAGWPVIWDGTVRLVEGDGDAWAHAAMLDREGRYPAGDTGYPAIMAYASGTFTAEIAARLPTCATVTIWPDRDPGEAGLRMAASVAQKLETRGITPTIRRIKEVAACAAN